MADRTLNEISSATDFANAYTEDASGNQVKISKADMASVLADEMAVTGKIAHESSKTKAVKIHTCNTYYQCILRCSCLRVDGGDVANVTITMCRHGSFNNKLKCIINGFTNGDMSFYTDNSNLYVYSSSAYFIVVVEVLFGITMPLETISSFDTALYNRITINELYVQP